MLLIYPTVVIGLEVIYQRPYSELIALSSAAFLAFGVFSLPAGWLADRWSRRNMMAAFYLGCGVSLAGIGLAPNLTMLAVAMFALGMFAAIYHPVGMAMLIEASGAKGRTLAFNGVCGNLGVSLAAGISAALATWFGWRAAFFAPAAISIVTGFVYLWLTPDDRHHTKSRQSKPAVPLTPKVAAMLFGLFLIIALSAGLGFQRVDHRAAEDRRRRRRPAPCRWCWSAASPPRCWCAARWRSSRSAGWSNGCRRTLSLPP